MLWGEHTLERPALATASSWWCQQLGSMQQQGQQYYDQQHCTRQQQAEPQQPGDMAWEEQPTQAATGQSDDILGYLPGYAFPNISSQLPGYTNAEQDLIHRSFHTGNYDYLKHLPDDIKHQRVAENRTARMQSARTTGILPSMGCTSSTRSLHGTTGSVQGLFQAFEYQSSPFDLELQLDAQVRVQSEAKRLAVSMWHVQQAMTSLIQLIGPGECGTTGSHQTSAAGKSSSSMKCTAIQSAVGYQGNEGYIGTSAMGGCSAFIICSITDLHATHFAEENWLQVGGKEFTPAGLISTAKHANMGMEGGTYPYMGGSYEAIDDTIKAHRTIEDAKQLGGAFVPPGTEKLTEKPTRQRAWDLMNNLRNCILKDWDSCQVSIFENQDDCWVVRVGLEGVDSLEGLRAYMNTLLRCNPMVLEYRLIKVPEFWHTEPGDGGTYYMLRPPWVKPDTLKTFYTMHPEEKQFSTSQAAKDLSARMQRLAEDDKHGGKRPGTSVTVLSRDSRLAWGTNCITGTAGTAGQGRGWGS